jgi:hypothetical protein
MANAPSNLNPVFTASRGSFDCSKGSPRFAFPLKNLFSAPLRLGGRNCPGQECDRINPRLHRFAAAWLATIVSVVALCAGDARAELPGDHPEFAAVRAILDANGLTKKAVEGVSIIENGHIVGLYLQEGGITHLTEHVGKLPKLRKLHLYGDRELGLPMLREISPAIGNCIEMEELLLNQNDLTTLPDEIARLENIRLLSVADNRLRNLSKVVTDWAIRFDPKGLAAQASEEN